jgi:hypothetical protein
MIISDLLDGVAIKIMVLKYNISRSQTIKSTQFGLIYIDSICCKNTNDYNNIIGDKSQQNKIIWSNPLYLK